MNWEFFDIVEIAMERGYKSVWAVHQAQARKIPIILDDLKELGEIYNHKPKWAIYTAQKFEIPPFDFKKKKQQRKNEVLSACQYWQITTTKKDMFMS